MGNGQWSRSGHEVGNGQWSRSGHEVVSGHHHDNVAGALGVLGLAVAVGGLVISSLGGSGGGSSPEAPGIPLLDRVPEPLPVGKKVKEASQQVTGKRKLCYRCLGCVIQGCAGCSAGDGHMLVTTAIHLTKGVEATPLWL